MYKIVEFTNHTKESFAEALSSTCENEGLRLVEIMDKIKCGLNHSDKYIFITLMKEKKAEKKIQFKNPITKEIFDTFKGFKDSIARCHSRDNESASMDGEYIAFNDSGSFNIKDWIKTSNKIRNAYGWPLLDDSCNEIKKAQDARKEFSDKLEERFDAEDPESEGYRQYLEGLEGERDSLKAQVDELIVELKSIRVISVMAIQNDAIEMIKMMTSKYKL